MLLEEQAFPFEEKATELHEVNARRAADGIYDKWVQEQLRRAGASCGRCATARSNAAKE